MLFCQCARRMRPLAACARTQFSKQAAVQVLRRAGEPLPVQEIAKRVLKVKGVELKGKNARRDDQRPAIRRGEAAGRPVREDRAIQLRPRPE